MDLAAELRGITPPLVTPFSTDGSIDHDALGDVVDHAVDGGVAGLFPNGTTGEFGSLTAAEREAVVETTVAHAGDRPVLAGVADNAIPDVLEHADRAAAAGADAVVVTPPYFHSESGEGGNRAFLERVADDAPVPTFVYDIPSCTGNPLTPETTLTLADHPNVVGMKDSSGDFSGFCRLLREAPDEFLLFQGFDALFLPSLRMGATGGVNALANAVPSAFAELYDVAETPHRDAPGASDDAADPERAREIQEAIGSLFDACLDFGFGPAAKAALYELDVIENPELRPPLHATDPESISAALSDVRSV